MSFQRTDQGKIVYHVGISSEDRRFCREFYTTLVNHDNVRMPSVFDRMDKKHGLQHTNSVVIGCSGGLDSTVLAHAYAQKRIIRPRLCDKPTMVTLVYINHGLRAQDEIDQDIIHVGRLATELGFMVSFVNVNVEDGNVQAQAREARYEALARVARQSGSASVYLAHHANDVAESKLWQFLTGRPTEGINRTLFRNRTVFSRPLLDFTREDLLRYARVWNLKWVEDSSNETDKYTRNRIRHHLIPWIEKEVNPGIVKMLGRSGG